LKKLLFSAIILIPLLMVLQKNNERIMKYKLPLSLLSGLVFCLAIPSLAKAATYYVATSGNDNNNGSISTPFRTVQRGVDALTAGDTLYLRGGTYTENVYKYNLGGTAQNLITISGYPSESVIINGNHAAPALLLYYGSNLVIENLTLTNGYHSPHGWGYDTLLLSNNTNVRVNNIDVSGTDGLCDGGSAQIMLDFSTYITIENSRIHDSNFQPNSGNTNCGGIGMMGGYGTGLGNITIRNNTIYNMPRGTAIWDKHPGYGTIEIANNTIYNVYVASYIRQRDIYFHHNRIYSTTSTLTDPTMRIFNESPDPVNRNIRIEYNTFASCPYTAILYTSGTNITLNNNIYYQCTESGDKRTLTICEYANNCAGGSGIAEIHSNNNCIYYTPTSLQFLRYNGAFYSLQQTRQQFGLDINSLFIDPQFLSTDPLNPNFLKPSPGNSCQSMGAFADNPTPPTPPASCAESWSCTAWSSCNNSSQTRTCTDANACGTTTSKPAEIQSCQIAPSCMENWSCTAWSSCNNSSQTRTCTDANACGTTIDRPNTMYACSTGNEAPRSGDAVSPNTQITASPVGTINSREVEFQWTGLDDTTSTLNLTYSYQIDSGAWSDWVSGTNVVVRRLRNSAHIFSVRARDSAGNIDGTPAMTMFAVSRDPYIVTGANAGGSPKVRVFDKNGQAVSQFIAYEKTFNGGVNVAMGDLGVDGTDEIIVGPGRGRQPQVKIFRRDGSFIASFMAYDSRFRGGVRVAVGDINGDGHNEIITSAGLGGGPQVRVFSQTNGSWQAMAGANTMVYDSHFRGGIFVASGDVNGDGQDEIVVTPGKGGSPDVRVFTLQSNRLILIKSGLMAYNQRFRGGITAAVGNVNTSLPEEILTGVYSSGGPQVRIFGQTSTGIGLLQSGFMAFNPRFMGGVNVATADTNLDGTDEIITAVNSNADPLVRIYNTAGTKIINQFYAYSRSFKGGMTVATGE
jgi:hypothetical protein